MPAPVLQVATPLNGATDVEKNRSLTFLFDIALLTSSVASRTVVLTNTRLNERVAVTIALSADGLTIHVVPNALLMPNTSYQVRLVGVDVDATNNLKSNVDSTAMAATATIAFQTGDTLLLDETDKSEGQTTQEGDAALPDDVAFKATAGVPLRLAKVTPAHHSKGIEAGTSQILFEFLSDLDLSTVTGNVLVSQYGFYEENDLVAVETDLGNTLGQKHYFRCETGYYTGGELGTLDPALFGFRPHTLNVSGPNLEINFETGVPLQDNVCIEVILGADISDTDGNALGEDLIWFGCSLPYPDWTSVMSVRHMVGHSATSVLPDDFVQLRIWQSTIDFAHQFGWAFDMVDPPRHFKMWVRHQASLDLFDDLLVDKALDAGTSKTLGDLTIRVNTAAGGARPTKMRRIEDRQEVLRRQIWGGFTQTPRVGIKSSMDSWEPDRGYFRDRLWRAEIRRNNVATPAAVANTYLERRQKAGGVLYTWYGSGLPGAGAKSHQC